MNKRLLTDKELDGIVEGDGFLYEASHHIFLDDNGRFIPLLKAQDAKTLKEVGEWLDIEFIINALKQSLGLIWQKRGQHICREQIRKLEAFKRGELLCL